MRLLYLLLSVVVSLGVSTSAFAISGDIVQNFSFETVCTATVGGSSISNVPTGWTQAGDNGCAFQALQSGDQPDYGSDFTIGSGGASLPTNGTRVLISDQSPASVSCVIYQDVAIPANVTANLTIAAGTVFYTNNGPSASTASVDVTTPGGTPIAHIYGRTYAQGNDALADRPSVNLTAYAGQTVRIIATVNVPSTAWTGLMLDNVRLVVSTAVPTVAPPTSVPTMTEWGMILFVMLAGAGSVYYLRRRRKES